MALYLDDLNIGDTFISEKYKLSKEEIIQFAKAFDPQVFHINEELAKETFFNDLVASGWHTAAITMRLIVTSVPLAHGIIGLGGEIDWFQPIRPNDILYVKSKLIEIKPSKSKPNQAIVIVECDTLNERDEVCQKLIAKLLCFRKSN